MNRDDPAANDSCCNRRISCSIFSDAAHVMYASSRLRDSINTHACYNTLNDVRATHLAGVLLSVVWYMASPSPSSPSPAFRLVPALAMALRLASTLTTIFTGFRSPTRTSSDKPSVIVALNRPVRRCFGRCESIRVSEAENPRSRSLLYLANVNKYSIC